LPHHERVDVTRDLAKALHLQGFPEYARFASGSSPSDLLRREIPWQLKKLCEVALSGMS